MRRLKHGRYPARDGAPYSIRFSWESYDDDEAEPEEEIITISEAAIEALVSDPGRSDIIVKDYEELKNHPHTTN